MFAYNPTVNDRSGEILGASQVNAAEINSQTAQQMGKDIGSAISSLGAMYAQSRMQSAGGKAFKDFMGVAGPSMGITDEQLKSFKTMNDQDAYQMSQMFMPVAPSMVSGNSLGKYYTAAALANQKAAIQNQVPQNQQPYTGVPATAPAAQLQANPAGGINMNFVK